MKIENFKIYFKHFKFYSLDEIVLIDELSFALVTSVESEPHAGQVGVRVGNFADGDFVRNSERIFAQNFSTL